nr:hypothetical protein [Bradyrhizobium sp.]
MQERRRPRQFLSLKDRLALYAREVRKKAACLPPGIERDALLEKARQADEASALKGRTNARSAPPPFTPKR